MFSKFAKRPIRCERKGKITPWVDRSFSFAEAAARAAIHPRASQHREGPAGAV